MTGRMTGPEVVTLGEAFIGLIADGGRSLADATTFSRHVIGAEANVAVGLARLGRRVAFVGRVGADGLKFQLRDREIRAHDVEKHDADEARQQLPAADAGFRRLKG